MEVLLLLLALAGLWVFIRYDKKRIEQSPTKPQSRAEVEGGFIPGRDAKWMGFAGVSLLGVIAMVAEVLGPSRPPFEGRWGWLWSSLHSAAGGLGIPLYWGALAAVAGVAAALAYRSSRRR